MTDKVKNFFVRALSGVVMAVVVIGAILLSPWSYGALLLLIMLGALCEFYRMTKKSGVSPQHILGVVMALVIFAMCYMMAAGSLLDFNSDKIFLALGLYFIVLLPTIFVCEMYRKSSSPIANIAATILGLVYVALPISLMCFLPMLRGDDWSPLIALAFIFIIWANDVFAYLVGSAIGKHRLFERISPKKSWEGFFGGVAGAIGMSVLAAYVMDDSVCVWIGLAVVASITGVFGDLVESMFKRSIDMKDSGKSIPGHGGWLDRFDALLISVPFVFVYLLIIKIIE